MTVSNTNNKVRYQGTDIQVTFPYTFRIFERTDLEVYIRENDGTEILKTLDSDYTVTRPGSASGGDVVFGSAPASNEEVVIVRVLPLTQEVDYVENDPFPAEVHEGALDKLTYIVQQQREDLDRKIGFSETSEAEDINLPDPESDKIIGWNTAADGMENYDNPETYATEARGYRDETLIYRNESEVFHDDSEESEMWARKWAINPQNVPVSGSEYSAKHWANEAQSAVDAVIVRNSEQVTTGVQQIFTLPWSINVALANLVVYINGVRQYPSNYTILSETQVQLDTSVPINTNVLFVSTETDAGYLDQIPQPSASAFGRMIMVDQDLLKYTYANDELLPTHKFRIFTVNSDASGYEVLNEAPSANVGRFIRVRDDAQGYEHSSALGVDVKTVSTSANVYSGETILVSAGTPPPVILLYANDGKNSHVAVKKIDGTNNVVRLKAVIGNIDNMTTFPISGAMEKQYFTFDGSNWWNV